MRPRSRLLPALVFALTLCGVWPASAGVHWTFAPMVDIARDPRWGRIAEGSGEDPYLGSAMAAARVRGFQGKDPRAPDAVLATVKHFAAYGGAEGGRDYNTVDLSERTLREVYLPPYHAAIDAGAGSVMTSFNEIGGIPSTASPWLMTTLLRRGWGFKGVVVSDWTAINELLNHGVAGTRADAGKLALGAGLLPRRRRPKGRRDPARRDQSPRRQRERRIRERLRHHRHDDRGVRRGRRRCETGRRRRPGPGRSGRHERRGREPRRPRSARRAAAVARGRSRRRHARGARRHERPAPDHTVGRGARARDRRVVVPGSRGRPRARRRAVRRREPERQAARHVPARGGANPALLQPQKHRTPHRTGEVHLQVHRPARDAAVSLRPRLELYDVRLLGPETQRAQHPARPHAARVGHGDQHRHAAWR